MRMNVRKIRSSKALKLLGLLISSLFIAAVSAQAYNTMFMEATSGVVSTGMAFVAHETDFTTCGGALLDNNQKVTFSTMDGTQGQLVTYDPVDINNADATAHTIELVFDSWTAIPATPLYSIKVSMWDSTKTTQQGVSIVLVPDGTGEVLSSGDVSIGATTLWHTVWEIYWTGSAVPGTDSVDVYLQLVIKS